MIPEMSLRMVCLVVLVKLIPNKERADSSMLRAVFTKVGRALDPTWH